MADTKAQIVLSAVDRTRAAFTSAQGNLDKLQAGTAAAVGRFTALGTAIATAVGTISLKGAIDALDQLDDISEKSGIAVEQLSGLRYAGEVVGTSFEQLAAGSSKLARNMAAAAGGSKEAQASFAAIGVQVRDANGALRSTDEVLLDVAERFSKYEDGAAKAALAQEIFGKSGQDLIPLLNQGRSGIEGLRKEAEQLGAVYGGTLAKQAAEFNDQLVKINLASEAVKVQIVGALLPSLNATAEAFIRNAKEGNLFAAVLKTIAQGAKARLGFDDFGKLESQARDVSAEIERVTNQIVGLSTTLQRDPGNEAAQRRYDTLRKKLIDLQGQAAKTSEAIKQMANQASPQRSADPAKHNEPAKTPAPIITKPDGSAAAEADRLLKAQLSARLKAIDQALESERDAFSFHQRELAAAFEQGNLSIDQLYAERRDAAERSVNEQNALLGSQIDALEQFAAQAKPADRVDAETRIAELLDRQAKLRQDAARDGALLGVEQQRGAEALRDRLREVEVQILELGGDATGAALLRLQQDLEGVRLVAAQAGVGQDVVDRLEAASQASIRLAAARREVSSVTDAAAMAEQGYLLDAELAGKSTFETERGLYVLRSQSLQQLQQLAEKARELAAANPTDPAAQQLAADTALQVKNAAVAVDDSLGTLNRAAAQAGSAIADTFGQFITGGKSAKDAILSLENQIADLIIQILVVEPLAESLSTAIKGIGKSGAASGGGDWMSGLFSLASSFFASAQGNVFTPSGPVAAFAQGDVFHSPQFFKFAKGGTLQNGVLGEAGPEGVLPLKRTASGELGVIVAGSAAASNEMTINVNVTAQQGVTRASALQQGRDVGEGIRRAMARNG